MHETLARPEPHRSWHEFAWSMFILATAGLAASADEAAPKLRYEWKTGSVFAYEVNITADRPDAVDQFQGVVTYTVKNVGDQQVDVSFAGNVGRKETPKATQKSAGPRRPGGPGGPGGPRGPMFGSTTMTGLTWQTNDVRLTKTGEFVSLKGTSQLPYLLGNLSLLPFENLSEEAKSTWTQSFGASITETGDNSRIPGPRFLNNEEKSKKTTSGGESIHYEIEKRDGQRLTLHRTSELKSTAPEGKAPNFELKLDGKLEFDAERSLTTSSESKGKLTVKADNISIEIPIVVKLRLLTEDERNQHEAKQKSANEERVAKAKEFQTQQQAKLATPLTEKERKDIITTLESGRPANISGTLMMLAKRAPTNDDKDIAKAIQKLLTNSNGGIRRNASDAWAKWSTLLVEDNEKTKPAANDKRKTRSK